MSQTRTGVVECPRCNKIWRDLQWGTPEVECTCHLFCTSGNTPADCNVTYPYNWSGSLGFPEGIHTDPANEGDDIRHATAYCNTHNKYIFKEPLILEVNWKQWEKEKLPKHLQLMRQ